jgi:hypothetical protein
MKQVVIAYRHVTALALLVLAILGLLGSTVEAQTLSHPPFVEVQSTTRAAPTVNPNTQAPSVRPLALTGLRSYFVTICAEEGETLDGTGYVRAYRWGVLEVVWMRNPDLDRQVTISGEQCQTFAGEEVDTGYGFVLYAADSVGVSGGSTVTVRIYPGVIR